MAFNIQPRWEKCVVKLEHANSGQFHWLTADFHFYHKEQHVRKISLGSCHKKDVHAAIKTLTAAGFQQTGLSNMREWQHITFERPAPSA